MSRKAVAQNGNESIHIIEGRMKPSFLIQTSEGRFLYGDRGCTIDSTPILSLACAFRDYREADWCARSLRRRGFFGIVCTIEGSPVTAAMLNQP
jgi:hypothetical protein